MKLIFYPGSFRQPCKAEYDISVSQDGLITRANIVVINSPSAGMISPLTNADEGRDVVLNVILANDLKGIRLDYIRFFVMIDSDRPFWMMGYEFPIFLNTRNFIEKGNPHEFVGSPVSTLISQFLSSIGLGKTKPVFNSYDVVGGSGNFYTEYEQRRLISSSEIDSLCKKIGYQPHNSPHHNS